MIIRAEGPDGGTREFRGARDWAQSAVVFVRTTAYFASADLAIVDGAVGAVFAPGGHLARVLKLTFAGGKIAQIDIIAAPARLKALAIAMLD